MIVLLYVSAIICGIIFKKSKVCTFYMACVMYVMSAFCYYMADLEDYKLGYNLMAAGGYSYYRYRGYSIFLKIWTDLGLSFEQYRLVFYFLVLLVLIVAIRIFTKEVNFVLSCYMIFSFPIDVAQMKSFLASSLMLLGLAILFKNYDAVSLHRRRWKFFWFFVLAFLSMLMHFSTFFYLLAVFAYFFLKKWKHIHANFFLLSMIGAVLIYSGGLSFIANIASEMGILGDMEYMSVYFEKSTNWGFLVGFFWVGLMVFCCVYNSKKMRHQNTTDDVLRKYYATVYLALPFLVLNMQYSRWMRIYMILLYIMFSKQFRMKVTVKKFASNIIYVFTLFISFYMGIYSTYDTTLGALFHYNSLFS